MTFDDATKATKKGDVLSIRHALEDGLDPNLTNRYDWTLLMDAAMNGNTAIGRLLIGHGADLDRKNRFGDTALSLAAHTGHPSFVKLLLERGVVLDASFEGFLDWAEKYGTGSREAMVSTRAAIKAALAARLSE